MRTNNTYDFFSKKERQWKYALAIFNIISSILIAVLFMLSMRVDETTFSIDYFLFEIFLYVGVIASLVHMILKGIYGKVNECYLIEKQVFLFDKMRSSNTIEELVDSIEESNRIFLQLGKTDRLYDLDEWIIKRGFKAK